MLKIYIMTHKLFDAPKEDFYYPIHVGRALGNRLPYKGDDSGDNISVWNPYYCELTGMYWVWKNEQEAMYVGICHYRRYLMNEEAGRVLTEDEYLKLLEQNDVITTKLIELNNSYYYGFSENHNIRDLDVTGEVIKEIYPDYYSLFEKLVHENRTYFGNMIVMKKSLYDAYCNWLFTILFEVQNRIQPEVEQYDQYHRRVYGFISEFLLYVYITYHQLKVCECKVGMISEKAETRELKDQLAAYFRQKNFGGAKNCFLAVYQKRPDVLMEASDITGELRLAMQIIATCEQEQEEYGRTVLDDVNEFSELVKLFQKLNRATVRQKQGQPDELDEQILNHPYVSDVAKRISEILSKK